MKIFCSRKLFLAVAPLEIRSNGDMSKYLGITWCELGALPNNFSKMYQRSSGILLNI